MSHRHLGTLLLLAVAAAAGPASAGVPDWAKPVIEPAPALPEGTPEWPERTLLNETAIVVSPDGGAWRIERHRVSQVLSAREDSTQFGFFAFDDTTKVKKSKGWHIAPGESAHRNAGGAMDINVSDNFLTDAKQRAVALSDVKKGSLLVYSFQAEKRPYTLTMVEPFFDGVPIALERLSIELPPGWTLKYRWLPDGGPEPAHTGTTWVFEQRDLTPAHEEPLDEAPGLIAPRLVLALQPPPGAVAAAPAFDDWPALGRWYAELDKGRAAPDARIEAATQEVLKSAGPAPLVRIRAVALFVRDRVRYVARELGIGGYQAHAAAAVLADGHGDCKDKSTLLRAALQVAGFESYPILVSATNPYAVAPNVPAPGSFDHVVVGVVWPKDAPFPDEAASSRVDAGGAGILLVLDPTDEYAWPGTLPYYLAGKAGAVMAKGGGVLVTLPDAEAKWHRIERHVATTMSADRSVTLSLVSRMYGGPAESARAANAVSYKDRRQAVEDSVRRAWVGAEVKDYQVTPEDKDGAYVQSVSLSVPASATALQDNVYWLFPDAPLELTRVPLAKRKCAVQFPYPMQLRSEVELTGAPKDYMPPDPFKQAGATWAVESAYRREGETVHALFSAELLRTHFEPSAFPDLKQFWGAATKAAGAGVRMAK